MAIREIEKATANQVANYDLDCSERLIALAGEQKTLHAAAGCAGRQLELMKPGLMGVDDKGQFFSGTYVLRPPGQMFYLVADAKRVAVIGMDGDIAQNIKEMVAHARSSMPANHDFHESLLGIAQELLKLVGDVPNGKRKPKVNPQAAAGMIGGLLAALTAETLERMTMFLKTVMEQDVCPAVVCLIGPATSGKKNMYSLTWPAMLPIGRYAPRLAPEY